MKLRKAERAAAALSAALLLLMAGRYWGAESARQTLPLPALAAEALPEEAAATEETAPAPSQPTEEAAAPMRGTSGLVVDLNLAGVEELTALPGIGETRAQAIVAWREENGPFRYIEDLIQVPGIGEGIFAGLEEYVTVGGN